MSDVLPPLQIKGLRDGLLITLATLPWDEARQTLLAYIQERQSFFQGARLALDLGAQALKVNELVELRDRLSEQGVSLWAVLSESPVTQNTAQLLGLATRISKPRPQEFEPSPHVSETMALWVDRTLRSGTRVEFPGHVVVWGDVNPGAEIIAGGSVLVWGRLRGSVHAGAQGNLQAMVAALEFSPMQARIADQIASLPAHQSRVGPKVMALKEGSLLIEDWQPT